MKLTRILTATMVFALAPMFVQAQSKPEGRELAELGFKAIDVHGNGYVHMGDMEGYRLLVFTSMDGNDDDKVTRAEFMSWDYGFQNIAKERDREAAYEAAQKVLFSFWDRDGDGVLTPSEHRHAVTADFRRADLNGDAILSEREFIGGFSIMVAMRAALELD